MFKKECKFEEYLNELLVDLMKYLCKFRTTNHHLLIEKGRHLGIERNLRTCTNCNKKIIGDEFHYFLACVTFKEIRTKMLKKYHYC
jgi:hypothetical protein